MTKQAHDKNKNNKKKRGTESNKINFKADYKMLLLGSGTAYG